MFAAAPQFGSTAVLNTKHEEGFFKNFKLGGEGAPKKEPTAAQGLGPKEGGVRGIISKNLNHNLRHRLTTGITPNRFLEAGFVCNPGVRNAGFVVNPVGTQVLSFA